MTSVESIPGFIDNEIIASMEDAGKKKRGPFWKNLTMEPVLGSSIMAVTMAVITFQNAFLQRACMVDLGYPENVCLGEEGPQRRIAEISSQRLIAQISVVKGIISSTLAVLVLMFLGPWSDRSRKRKPLVLLPIGGMVVAYLFMIILIMIPTMPVIWMVYLEMLPMALTGGFSLMFMAAFSHLGDICYKTGRDATSLMGMNSAIIAACSTIGSMAGPFIYRYGGLTTVFAISLILQIFSFVYTWQKMEDVNEPVDNVRLLDLSMPIKALQSLYRKREGRKRKVLMLMVVASLVHSFLMSAEMVNMYMYLRNKYNWTEMEFGIFTSYKSVLGFFSTLFIIKIMKNKMKVADEMLGVIGSVSHGVVVLMLYLASNTLQVFLSPILGILQPASNLVHKPILIKQIDANEQGQINSVISVMDMLVHLFVSPASSALYAYTVSTIPGVFLLPCIAISFLQSFCFIAIVKRKYAFPAAIFSSMYMYYMAQYQ